VKDTFHRLAQLAAQGMGSPWAFLGAVVVCLVWAASGPMFHYSDTWQLVINTGTTIATFLMVFLIQNTQNRDARAIHLKLDELIRALEEPRTGLVGLEKMTDEELNALEEQFERLQAGSRHEGRRIPRERESDDNQLQATTKKGVAGS
jgi:low affinity Fe/Cu permease